MYRRQNNRNSASIPGGTRPISLEDAELIERVKAGEVQAYGDLVRKYQDRVFNTCWRITGHQEDARDLTQDAFLKAYEKITDFRQDSGFYTWIFRVAVNLSLSHRRQSARRRMLSLDQESYTEGTQAETLARRIADQSSTDPSLASSEAEMRGKVADALQALDADHRAVVVLRDMEGMDYQTIGEILNIPPGTVKSRLFRARSALSLAIDPAQKMKEEG